MTLVFSANHGSVENFLLKSFLNVETGLVEAQKPCFSLKRAPFYHHTVSSKV